MKIGILFPGYESQHIGMAKDFYDTSCLMQEYFETASTCLPINFVKLCFASSDIELGMMENAFTSIFLVSASIGAILKEHGIEPTCVAGYDTGWVAALHLVESISLPDALYFLSKYASFYQDMMSKSDHGFELLRIIGCDRVVLEQVCAESSSRTNFVGIAVYESKDRYVVSGHSEATSKLRIIISERELGKVEDSSIELGLHNAYMDPVIGQLRLYLEKIDFKDSAIPLITATDVVNIVQGEEIKEYALQFMAAPMHIDQMIQNMASQVDIIVQVGPGNQYAPMLDSMHIEIPWYTIRTPDDLKQMVSIINLDAK